MTTWCVLLQRLLATSLASPEIVTTFSKLQHKFWEEDQQKPSSTGKIQMNMEIGQMSFVSKFCSLCILFYHHWTLTLEFFKNSINRHNFGFLFCSLPPSLSGSTESRCLSFVLQPTKLWILMTRLSRHIFPWVQFWDRLQLNFSFV